MKKITFPVFALILLILLFLSSCAVLSELGFVDQKPHEYLEMIAKEHGEHGTCPDGCQYWRVKLSHTSKVDKGERFIGYALVYGILTEKAVRESNYPSQKYLLIERTEIFDNDSEMTSYRIVEQYIDFGPDFQLDLAYATGPSGRLVGLNPGMADKYFKERRYPELKKFIKNGWFHIDRKIKLDSAEGADYVYLAEFIDDLKAIIDLAFRSFD